MMKQKQTSEKFKAAPWVLFKVVITLIFGAIAITKIVEIYYIIFKNKL